MSDDGYARVSLADVQPRELDDVEPTLLSVGYELRPSEMRPNVWRFEPGESTTHHHHREQEELYVVLEGSFEATVGDDADEGGESTAGDAFELAAGDYLVVEPGTWRQLTATAESLLLAVGAPPVADDAVTSDGE